MSISPQSGASGLERLVWLESYAVRKQQNIFNVGLNAAKNMCLSRKASNKSWSESHFVQKSLRVHMSISPCSGARELERLIFAVAAVIGF